MVADISSSTRLLPFTSRLAQICSLNMIMVKTFLHQCAKASLEMTDRIPPLENVKGMIYGQIEAALASGASMLGWLKQYLRKTLIVNDNRAKMIVGLYWPLTQWLVELVSTSSHSHFLRIISTLLFHTNTHQHRQIPLPFTLRMTIIPTVRSAVPNSGAIVLLFIVQ